MNMNQWMDEIRLLFSLLRSIISMICGLVRVWYDLDNSGISYEKKGKSWVFFVKAKHERPWDYRKRQFIMIIIK